MTVFANHEYSVRTLNVVDENGNVGCAICGRGKSVHRNVTNELRLTAEDGTEYVLPGDFFAGPLKPGTRGTWKGFSIDDWHGTVVVGRPDRYGRIVVEDGEYCVMPLASFTPDPEPTTTVMVEMSVEDARLMATNDFIFDQIDRETLTRAAVEALKKAGLL